MPNQFVQSLISFSFILILAVSITAQEKCDFPANAPKLLNLNLGMPVTEVKNVFGRDLNFKIKNTGERIFFQNYIDKSAPISLHGVRALYLRFLEGKLYQIEVFYENRADWQTLSDFTKNLSGQMNFTENLWQVKQNKALIDCQEFTLMATNVLNPRIEITDEIAKAKVETLRKAKDK
jgi:hypothetical protein